LSCNVKPSYRPTDQGQGVAEPTAVLRLIEPARCAARMRQRDEDAPAIDSTLPDHIAERDASPEAIDRERSDEKNDARPHERELCLEPWRAESDLGWRRTAIPRSSSCFPGKAFRDRRAIWKVFFIDAGLREPAPELGTRASRERQTRGELDRAGSLANDHHAIGRPARDDRER